MKMNRSSILPRPRATLLWAVALCILVLSLAHIACQSIAGPTPEAATPAPAQPVILLSTAAPTSQPQSPSSVMVYIKMVIEKKYGFLAHIVGKRDFTERDIVYDIKNNWWDNPLIVYADAPFVHSDVTGQADAEAIVGEGVSSNADVRLTLTPHAVVSLRTNPPSDGIKGTITVSINTLDEYFDGGWIEMVRTKDKLLTFSFDTCDPGRPLAPILHETRAIDSFSLEHYTRDHDKWDSRKHWPEENKSGDARVVIYGKNAVLNVTGYRYAGH
jgi:hypothetical protein